jgi:GNAT superfamily N-acetyltransferase
VIDSIKIVRAGAPHKVEVFSLVYPLLFELYPDEPTYTPENVITSTERLLESHPDYFGFIAYAEGKPVGYMGLSNCASIYASGSFGEIAELYVKPEHRSTRVGAKLVAHAIAFGKKRGWSMLEVGAPSVPAWQRTVDFYQRNGFEVVGPRLYQTR